MRFNDSEDTNPGQMDFVPRRRHRMIGHDVGAFAVTIIFVFMVSLQPNLLGGHVFAGLASIIMIGLLCYYVMLRKQQNLDLVMSTEYQNMMFSQAIAVGYSFCLFVRADGTIVYANDGLKKIFPHAARAQSRALQTIFEDGGVRPVDRDRVMSAIHGGGNERIVLPLPQRVGPERDYVITIEPLPRPAGYMMVRGREFRDSRAGTQVLPETLRSTSAERLEQLLSSTSIAHYVSDNFGRFEYVNPAMERLFGYEPGELVSQKTTIRQLLHQLQGQFVSEETPLGDFMGEATFMHKRGVLNHAILQQVAIRDDNGKIIAASGSILPHQPRN